MMHALQGYPVVRIGCHVPVTGLYIVILSAAALVSCYLHSILDYDPCHARLSYRTARSDHGLGPTGLIQVRIQFCLFL